MVSNQVKIDEEDLRDIQFWLDRPASERIAEVTRLRRAYYSWLLGTYPPTHGKNHYTTKT